jgi:hypothetical protein
VGFFKRDNIKQAFEISGGKKGGQLKMNLGYSLSLLGVMIINLLRIHTSMIKGYHKEDKLN